MDVSLESNSIMIFLRESNKGDLPLIMAWRNSPFIFSGFYSQDSPLSWNEHFSFWKDRNKDTRQFMVVLLENDIMRDVGVVRIQQLDYWSPEIGFMIGEPELWGKGIGKKAVSLGLDWMKEKGYKYTHTTVLESNTRSIKLLEGLGFKYFGKARKGEIWMIKSLSES